MVEKEGKKVEKTTTEGYSVRNVVVETRPGIIMPDGETEVSDLELLAQMANDIAELKKKLIG